MEVFIPVATMAFLGLVFSLGLVFAYRKLKVEEDPRIEQISELLPQANCGACGYSGCRAFAESVVRGIVEPNGCPVGGEDTASQITDIMGLKPAEFVKKIARVHCRGNNQAAPQRGNYLGITTCYASHLVGGNKKCSYGCLGFGDCVKACPFEAMYMSEEGLPVVIEEKCTACGICVDVCPRNIMELHPAEQNIIVFCRSEDRGAVARKVCKNACIACGICVRACPEAIILENNLAVIKDFRKIDPEKIPEIERCPTDSIGRIIKS